MSDVVAKVRIDVEFRPMKGDAWATTEEVKAGEHYRVVIASNAPLSIQRQKWLHEVGLHVQNYLWARTIGDKREHRFISAIERSFTKLWNRWMEGKS